MADEASDVSNVEQLIICVRWVDEKRTASEDFIGLQPLNNTTADTIVNVIKDVLLRMNLRISDSRGQCYDGDATMSGAENGNSI